MVLYSSNHTNPCIMSVGVVEPNLSFLLHYSRFNSSKKDNDFIYHESVPALDTLPSVKGMDGTPHQEQDCS